jgi:uncharacterized protein YcaQ
MPAPPFALPLTAARRIWLHAQRLDRPAPFGDGPDATPGAVRHLGYVQIDTIHVVERCHHHILYTRIPSYRREHLHQAQSVDRTLAEYWTHALAYLPTEHLRFYIRDMRRHWERRSAWFGQVKEAEVRRVLRLIRRRGPLTIRDIEDDELVDREHLWASRKPSKRALQLAFYRGQVTISRRTGMLKTYELMNRHFGWRRLPGAATDGETLDYLLDRALRAQGVVSLDSACAPGAGRKPAMRRLIQRRVRRGELVPVQLEGAGKQEHWARPEVLEALPPPGEELVHILSPFDPLVIQRKRLKLFFGYEHRFEAYLPKEKRVFGYFALPVLVGDRIVAAIDCKADRERGRLLIQQWTWVADGPRRGLRQRIEEALGPFERFQITRTE